MSNLKSSQEIQDEINNKRAAIEQEKLNGQQANHKQINQWENEISILEMQLADKKAEEAQQSERVQAQEEEVQAITLPYDFNEILSDGDFKVTKANDMIIEVVRDVKRQSNIEKNQAVDEVKAEYDGKVRVLQANIDDHKNVIIELTQNLADLKDDYDDLEIQKNQLQSQHETMHQKASQAITDRDDAYTKRDAAFRQLQEAQDEIEVLRIKLENAPVAKQPLDISSSDKLAKIVKDSLAEKANRGLARWNLPAIEVPSMPITEIPTLESQFLADPPIPAAQEEHPKDAENTNTDVHSGGTEATEGNQAVHELVQQAAEETTVIEFIPPDEMLNHLYKAHNELKVEHAALAARVDNIERHANIQAVA